MTLFNEGLVSTVLYFYIVATDYNEVIEMRDYSGLGILSAIVICVLVNLTKFFAEVISEMKQKLPAAVNSCL